MVKPQKKRMRMSQADSFYQSQSQPSSTQNYQHSQLSQGNFQNTQQSQFSQGNLEENVNNCVTKILAESFTLRAYKKADLMGSITIKGKAGKSVIEEVKKKLLHIYGLKLEEFDGKFVLINAKNKIFDQFKTAKFVSSAEVFLAIILTLIVHNEDEISLDEINSFLTNLTVSTEVNDSYFGNIKKLFTDFEQQLYLEKTVKPSPSGSQTLYKWGVRSKHEVNKKDLIPIIAMMYQMRPESLPAPLKRLYSDNQA